MYLRLDRKTGGYVMDRSSFLPPLMFTLEEALGLMHVTRVASHHDISPEHRAAIKATLKIESMLPAKVRQQCDQMLESAKVRYWPLSRLDQANDVMASLLEARIHRRQTKISYNSYHEQSEIETILHPYQLLFLRRGWYVIGYSQLHNEVRTFKVERITRLDLLEDAFELRKPFDIDTYLGNAWQMIRGDQRYHVVLDFSPRVAGNVEEIIWHKTQQTRPLPGGSLRFEVDVDGLEEISWWVLGYGKEVVVREPAELRNLIAEHVKELAGEYLPGANIYSKDAT